LLTVAERADGVLSRYLIVLKLAGQRDPRNIAASVRAVAAREGISLNDVARRALLNDLRARGLIEAA
jgi:hypothetical protein